MKNVRLEDIAKRLNITKVSVSKALRDYPDISVETRRKVKKLAREMGYRPNLQARSLASSKTKTVGVIVPKIAHYFFSPTIEGIYRAAQESGYKVIIGISLEDETLQKEHIESMMDMRVDGLLVSLSEKTTDTEVFEDVRRMGIDLVFFDRGISGSGFSYVRVEDRKAAKKAVSHLTGLGYCDIAHISGYQTSEIGKDRKLGFLDAMEEAGLDVPDSSFVESGFGEEDGYFAMEKLLDQRELPEALFAVTFPVGLGVLQFMQQNNIDPARVQILTFGGSNFNWALKSPFLCSHQPTIDLGKRAFSQLLEEMKSDKEQKPKLVEIPAGEIEEDPSPSYTRSG
ncbi:MAG: LacI family DNA-binding transcriptional regulator [Balneolaceae bacterium]